jgi:hypothetical protein
MKMEREINFLSDDELAAVVGGRMNNGQINQLTLKNPNYGVPGSGKGDGFDFLSAGVGLVAGIMVGSLLAAA